MNNSEQTYESNILKIAINKYLEKKLINPEINLKAFELNKDEIVWDVVSTIYTQSAYKLSMSFARDIVYQRINDMKYQLKKDEEKARLEMIRINAIKAEEEKARLEIIEKARLEMIRINAIKAEEEKARFEMMKIKAEEEKTRKEMMRIKAEEEKANQEKRRLEKERKINNYIDSLPKELNFDKSKLDVFIKVHQLLCEEYSGYAYGNKFYEDQLPNTELLMEILETKIFTITLYEGSLSNFTKVSWPEHHKWHTYKQVQETCTGDSIDATELIMTLEEEFEIEITDEEVDSLTYMKDIVDCIYRKITNL